MDARYFFTPEGKFYFVALMPEPDDRQVLPANLIDYLGAPNGNALIWKVGDVEIIDRAGLLVTITNTLLEATESEDDLPTPEA